MAVRRWRSEELDRLVERQSGVFSRGQAVACGVGDGVIRAALAAGACRRVLRGVYVSFNGPLPRLTEIWAALLYAGPTATASHQTAAELDGLLADHCARPDMRVHVTVHARRRVRPQPGLVIHLSGRVEQARHPARLPPRTKIEETVLDLVAGAATFEHAVAVVAEACRTRLTTPQRIHRHVAARQRLRWRDELAAVLDNVSAGVHSALELQYLTNVERAHALPTARRQRKVARGARAEWTDAAYEQFATLVELDGRLGHESASGRLRDLRRDNAAMIAGEATLRYGWADVLGRPCEVAAQVVAVLRARGWTGKPPGCALGLENAWRFGSYSYQNATRRVDLARFRGRRGRDGRPGAAR